MKRQLCPLVALVFGCSVIAVLMTSAAPAQQPVPEPHPSVELPPALARVLTDYEVAWRNKDAAALAVLFAEDGFVLSGSRPPVRGRAAIEEHYTGKGGPLSLRALAYATEGSVGYIIGAYSRNKGQPDVGKFTLTLKKRDDGWWLIMSDMDNGNSRPKKRSPE
jgi:ketosteroid isomerase-like protein